MSKIYLIRHGFTPANNANYNNQRGLRAIAENETMPLDKIYGEKQAIELGKFLNSIKGNALVLVSPYKRTRQTLELALNEMNKEVDIEVCNDIREIDPGIHYARTRDEVLELEPNAYDFYEKYKEEPNKVKYIGGESNYDVRDRVKDISKRIIEISKSKKYDNIFIFSHGEANRWIYYHINGEPLERGQKNCEVIVANGRNKGKSVFVPNTFVPKGYMVDIADYKRV